MRDSIIQLLRLPADTSDAEILASVKVLTDAEAQRQVTAAWERRISEKTAAGLRREEAIESIQNQDAEDARRLSINPK
jgi:hypothetical protein